MNLKATGLALAIALGVLTLSGCEESPDPEATAQDEAEIDSQTRAAVNKDEAELKEELAKAQAQDPAIQDIYYGVDDQNQKVVHVIREVKDPATGVAQSHDSAVPMMQGMVLGMLMSNMMNNNYSNYARGYGGSGSYSSSTYARDDDRRRKNIASSSYVGATRASTARSFVSSRPTSAYSSRAGGVFSSSSSARAGGYSAGG